MEPEIKATRINNRWHSRLIENGKVLDEMACGLQEDIGWICRELLRWYSKMGGVSRFAESARKRQTGTHKGKVWYVPQITLELGKLDKIRR
jgi:hypothetical protein